MYSDRLTKRKSWILWTLLILLLLGALCLLFSDGGRDLDDSSALAIREAVQRSALLVDAGHLVRIVFEHLVQHLCRRMHVEGGIDGEEDHLNDAGFDGRFCDAGIVNRTDLW